MFKGGLHPGYVLDGMPPYEVTIALEGVYMKSMDSWEQTRMVCRMTAQVNSRKRIRLQDIMAFPWDEKPENHDISKNEMERLKVKMNSFMNNKNN